MLTFLPLSILAQEMVFNIHLYYEGGEIVLTGIDITDKGLSTSVSAEGDFRLDLVSLSDTVLYQLNFDFFFAVPEVSYEDGASQEAVSMSFLEVGAIVRAEKSLAIPYFVDAKEIKIYDSKNTLKLSKNIEMYTKICGNSICEDSIGEDNQNCPGDCPLAGLEPEKMAEEGEKAIMRKALFQILAVLGIAIAVGVLAYFYYQRKRIQ